MAFNTRFDAAGSEEDAGDGTKRETLLRDLLEDPFARRVYEDIYSEIQQRKNAPADPPKPKKLSMEWGNKNFQLDLTDGLGGAIKDWMRGQIDEEQELYFPASSLFPGARVRLQIRQGFSRKPRTLEVTLPQDFVVGKPVRLKGMGQKNRALAGRSVSDFPGQKIVSGMCPRPGLLLLTVKVKTSRRTAPERRKAEVRRHQSVLQQFHNKG